MPKSALVIGGTRFIGRHTVEELLDHDYHVTIFNRGNHDNPFATREGVDHVEGDRRDETDLKAAKLSVRPDIVIDCVAYYPADVDIATDLFTDVEGYVYISSGDAYGEEEIPKREDATPMRPCTEEQAVDDAGETYGNRKAEGDRKIVEAAEEGVNAMSIRPCIVYGPYDYTERMDYWLDRVDSHDRVVVPGDGQNLWHRAYAPDVAKALRVVAENGEPGGFYNVGDQRAVTLEEMLELIADAMDTDIEVVTAGENELAAAGLSPEDFVLYRDYPHLLDVNKLADLGWESTPLEEAMARSVEEHRESDRDGAEYDPGRENEETVLDVLDTL
ncbi:NAD-dependent epimerase/dehydratase family protein [Halolamina salifodinae]|uniref:Nucleoside-diphosphate-sugar epimerase n=1 Tax=Halolamina salifodinae TaxID=1202767 RepID=A0A8T4GW47_9EURY|nr:NAD-dependent epimerase/dehydratase family protein [Halolamina salifodinae]MBP1985528.1 nucleoside-diphosphate-sugar epimerase [Halolamina salifodinae]